MLLVVYEVDGQPRPLFGYLGHVISSALGGLGCIDTVFHRSIFLLSPKNEQYKACFLQCFDYIAIFV